MKPITIVRLRRSRLLPGYEMTLKRAEHGRRWSVVRLVLATDLSRSVLSFLTVMRANRRLASRDLRQAIQGYEFDRRMAGARLEVTS